MQCKKMQHEIVTYGKEETEITHQSEKQITDSLMKELYTLMSLSRVKKMSIYFILFSLYQY